MSYYFMKEKIINDQGSSLGMQDKDTDKDKGMMLVKVDLINNIIIFIIKF